MQRIFVLCLNFFDHDEVSHPIARATVPVMHSNATCRAVNRKRVGTHAGCCLQFECCARQT